MNGLVIVEWIERPGMGSRRRGNDGVETPLTKT